MEDFILIKRENLEKVLEDAHKWRAMVECTEIIGDLSPGEWDAIILEYCENTGLSFPSNFSGVDALDMLIYFDIDVLNEVLEYDKRKND
jgi:hypothetical protein